MKPDGEAAAIKRGQAELKVGVRMDATISTRNYLSAQHLWTARHNAERGQRVEPLEPRVSAMLASFWESVGKDVTNGPLSRDAGVSPANRPRHRARAPEAERAAR